MLTNRSRAWTTGTMSPDMRCPELQRMIEAHEHGVRDSQQVEYGTWRNTHESSLDNLHGLGNED
jgi:hypothetical protein